MAEISPLKGVRVVDLTDGLGEMCARLLGDFGADVVRVEPATGSNSRALPPLHREESLSFAYRNFNKSGVALDLSSDADRARFQILLRGTDILVESGGYGARADLGLDNAALCARHPHLVLTSISNFGLTGPYRDWVATDAVMEAMGGVLFKAGVPEREPLLPPVPIAYETAAVMATYASLLARLQQVASGSGQHIDVSVFEAIAQAADWSMATAGFARAQGNDLLELRAGSGAYSIFRCRDGHVRLLVLSPRQWHAMRAWIGEPELFQDPFWDAYAQRLQNSDIINPLFEAHLAGMDRDEVAFEAQRRGIACTPVLKPEEVLENAHFASRDTFVNVEVAPEIEAPTAAGFFSIDGVRQGFRHGAPSVGNHTEMMLNAAEAEPRPKPAQASAATLPLAGVRVLDFGIGGVGVEGSRLLAEFGADVIKIESRTYPDFIRVLTGAEMSAQFASSSRTKRGFGVNVKTEGGRQVLHKLIAKADVIIENNSTGTMDALGLGYDIVKSLNPRCVMVSSQLLGHHGAWSQWIGYGPSAQPLAGLVHLWNYANAEAPAGSTVIFPDHLAGRLTATAAAACLVLRGRTDVGAHSEVAQVEAVTGLMGDLLMKTALEPGSVVAAGNRSDMGAPWGVYPCAGEQQWIVISCRSDTDWQRLVTAMGTPDWATPPAYTDVAGRQADASAIDVHIAEWTARSNKIELTQTLQAARVPAGPMLTGGELLDDTHLIERGFPLWIEQQDLGRTAFEGPAFRASGMGAPSTFQAPRLGEHTVEICRELLEMDASEIEKLIADGVLEVSRVEALAAD
jgi:crotonobetainyl-CoA:carnitine CoA-transferase CaiB-like acyl-CoA transferase